MHKSIIKTLFKEYKQSKISNKIFQKKQRSIYSNKKTINLSLKVGILVEKTCFRLHRWFDFSMLHGIYHSIGYKKRQCKN